jgi:hypothetical protein
MVFKDAKLLGCCSLGAWGEGYHDDCSKLGKLAKRMSEEGRHFKNLRIRAQDRWLFCAG